MPHRRLLSLLSLLFLVPAAGAQSLQVVDASGAADYTSLKKAIYDAKSGDTLLVKSSIPFDEALIDGKSLTIVGDGAVPTLLGSLIVQNLPSSAFVTVRGLTFSGSAGVVVDILAHGNQGTVVLEDVTCTGAGNEFGFKAEASPGHIALVRCDLSGGVSIVSGLAGPGVHLAGVAWVSAYASTFTGGAGAANQPGAYGVDGSFNGLLLADCSVTGGDNGAGYGGQTTAGLYVHAGSAFVRDQDSSFLSGGGGPSGPGLVTFPGTSVDSPGDAPRHLATSAVVREGQAGSLDYTGQAGDSVGLFLALAPVGVPLALQKGIYHLGGPVQVLVASGIAVDGTFSLPFLAQPLPTGLDSLSVVAQAVASHGAGVRLTNPSTMTLLAAGF